MDSLKTFLKGLGIDTTTKPMSTEEFSQFQVDCYNQSVGDLDKEDGVKCEMCKNKGYISYLDGIYIRHYRCKCIGRREAHKRAKQSGLGKYLNKTLDDYVTDEEWRVRCKRIAETFIERHSNDDTWFIACGQNGSGKTLLGSIIANTLLTEKERAVMYVTWTDFIGEVKRCMMSEKADDVSDRMKEIKNADVLFLDEVLKKHNDTDLRYRFRWM